ncbi:hypothetical protein CSA37_02095 [Candidatus Fermentibacteria bacterium]|nr:MAG: hypothetical protein CSA37_02095 [Candidatus Fermentibacteria bacterium]
MRYLEEFRDLLARRAARTGERTFGFEYELISSKPVSYEGFRRVKDAVTEAGFVHRNRQLIDDSGMYITFEPGGQIEFSSPPLRRFDFDLFDMLLDKIDGVVEFVKAAAGVEYLPKPYIAGRGTAPMLLEAERYKALHELLGRTGNRGREMMKGTAAIHFHAALMNTEELLRLWIFMCSLSREEGFRMGPDRRDIWNRTDPSRCGLTCTASKNISNSSVLVEQLVSFALRAVDLHTEIPFGERSPQPDFISFLEHFSTIFTDVRLNLKGMTIELRTLDSRPLHLFRETWLTYLDMFQRVMDDRA